MKLNVGIIGLGYWGKHYIRIVLNSYNSNLVAICDTRNDFLEHYSTLNNLKIFYSYIDLFNSGIIDTVIITTPASTHYNIIQEALKYKLNIFVEKPFVIDLNDALYIKNNIMSDTKLMIGHTYIYSEKINFIKKYLIENSIKLTSINIEWSSYCNTSAVNDTNAVFDLAVHPLSILLYFFPECNFKNFNTLVSKNGFTYIINFMIDEIIVGLQVSLKSPGKTRRFILSDENIKIVLDDTNDKSPIKIYSSTKDDYVQGYSKSLILNNYININQDGTVIVPKIIQNNDSLTIQFESFINYVNNNETIISDINFSYKIIELCTNILNKI